MRIEAGYQVDDPAVFIDWTTPEDALAADPGLSLRKVTGGYFVLDCVSLGGLKHSLGLHFRDGALRELELFISEPHEIADSFPLFQTHLESAFGPPTSTGDPGNGFPSHEWRVGTVWINHYVFERFMHEEHVRIRNAAPLPPTREPSREPTPTHNDTSVRTRVARFARNLFKDRT